MTKTQLLNHLTSSGILKTPTIIRAVEKIDRADFILPEFKDNAYEDRPLPIGFGQTISQPSTVAFMLELLQIKPGEKILDLGSGSGWTTALLAEIAGPKSQIFGLEIIESLAKFGQDNLAKYSLLQAQIIQADKDRLGLPGQAPFDKILASAAATSLPEELVLQLKIGGRLVLPINNSIWQIDRIAGNKISRQEFPGFVFVPLKS